MVGAYLSCTMETMGDDTRPLILQVTNSARVALDLQDIVNSHIDGKPTHRQQCHCQIITRFKSVDTKFYILLNSKKFEERYFRKRGPYLFRDCLWSHCRQRRLKTICTSNGKITMKDHTTTGFIMFAMTRTSSKLVT